MCILTFQDLTTLEEQRFIDEELLDDYWVQLYEAELKLKEQGKLIYFLRVTKPVKEK